MKKKTSIYLEEHTLNQLRDISRITGISIARFIERSVNYVLENNLEQEIFFPKSKKKIKEKGEEEKEEKQSFKLKL